LLHQVLVEQSFNFRFQRRRGFRPHPPRVAHRDDGLNTSPERLPPSTQFQRSQVRQLQRQLAGESGKKALTGLFAGLAGAVIWGALRSNSNSDDEDAYVWCALR
ncbi:hypothetical protein, partial [Myxococcus vastator]|uniref:hypothetical protein n=1 Tax=Myxococcus vastator TaxID=2709664 RepID=UPI0019688CBB